MQVPSCKYAGIRLHNVQESALRLTCFSFLCYMYIAAAKLYYLLIARHVLHANVLGLCELRVDARARGYTSVSVCVHVISSCMQDKELIKCSQTQAFESRTFTMYYKDFYNVLHSMPTYMHVGRPPSIYIVLQTYICRSGSYVLNTSSSDCEHLLQSPAQSSPCVSSSF